MDKIILLNENGEEKKVNLITIIYSEKYKSSYLAYMENEISDKNIISFAKIKEENGEMYLDNIEDTSEFNELINKFGKELYK